MSRKNGLNAAVVIPIILFVLIILGGFALSCRGLCPVMESGIRKGTSSGIREGIDQFETGYNAIFSARQESMDLFSAIQRLLLKKETRNFEVLRADDGQLYLNKTGWPSDEATLSRISEQICTLRDATEAYGGKFLFVQVPYKNAGMADDLRYYSDDQTEQAETRLLELLSENEIYTLDLRTVPGCAEFYRTDHHWTVEAGYRSAAAIANFMEQPFCADLGDLETFSSLTNYRERVWPDSFLGSIGIKVGPYYAGRDDFTVYDPLFRTEMEFNHYRNGERTHHYEGDFWETMIEQRLLNDPGYNNKHYSLMHSAECYTEVIVDNYCADNDYNVLCVIHSYGRSLCAYLSLYFSRLTSLDPQNGRYNEDYLLYIQEHQPDFVVFAYNDLVNLGYE